jgi:protein farnesyltransferase/geranylgeranyltransferase type-1 subunit alpha
MNVSINLETSINAVTTSMLDRDATSYFRAVVKANEHSQRVLDLTLHIINMNPAHYTVWQYRWTTLLALHQNHNSPSSKQALLAEQTLMEDIAIRYLKTYQVWHHRRLLLIHLKNPLPELLFISNALQSDAKNYHTWAYRQWILNHFVGDLSEEVWEDELSFAEHMLEEDVRNNSAWHHRFFVVWHPSSKESKGELLRRELRF